MLWIMPAMGKRGSRRRRNKAKRRLEVVEVVRDAATGLFVARHLNDAGHDLRAAHRGGIVHVDRNVLAGGVISGKGGVAIGESFIGYLFFRGLLGDGAIRTRRESSVQWVLDRYHKSGLHLRTTAAYEGTSSRSTGEMSQRAASALSAYGQMWIRLGERRANILQDVVAFDIPCNDLAAITEALDAMALWQGWWDGKPDPPKNSS